MDFYLTITQIGSIWELLVHVRISTGRPSIDLLYSIEMYEQIIMSEAKEDLEDAGNKMESGAKKTGSKIEDAGKDAKDKID